jgi:hypothetical protein
MNPTELICPVSLEWVKFDEALKQKILDKNYSTLNEGSQPFEKEDIESVKRYLEHLKILRPNKK